MDTNALKKFAQSARNLLIDQVASKLDVVLADGSAARREAPKAVKDLENAIARDSRQQVIEQVAYIWFNRFTALRFMDANGYTQVRTVSPADGATRPELLSEAMAGNIPDNAPATIQSLLDGRTPSHDPQAEAYRLLLVHTCNQWHGPMPFLFEQIDDYTELLMPEDLLSQTSILAELRKVMTEDACQDVEIIGWLYQFYISEKKDQVFAGLKKNQKITAENIPAATQLFTPHWIVRYLVENSLGRLWLLNNPQSGLAAKMDYYIAPEEPETDFLKITKPEEIRICDPAAGSGHMLTYAFDLLHAIYEEEGYDATEIPALILTHNLTGVEIDDRAGALAAFALAMKAAGKLGRRRFLRMEAKPDICVLQNVAFTDAEMQDVAAVVGKDLFTDELRETLGQFEQAKNFGSLIVPKLRDPAETLRVVEARDFGGDLLLKEVQKRVIAVLRMAEALSPKYHVVVANPPYMGGRGMNAELSDFAKMHYADSKLDTFACFIERANFLVKSKGYSALVTMESWMFLSTYGNLRNKLLSFGSIRSLVHMPYLGKGGTAMGISFGTSAFVYKAASDPDFSGSYSCTRYYEMDAAFVPYSFPTENERLSQASTKNFLNIPGSPIAYWVSDKLEFAYGKFPQIYENSVSEGQNITANNDRYTKSIWEVNKSKIGSKWRHYAKGGEFRRWHGNLDTIVDWSQEARSHYRKHSSARIIPEYLQFRPGITWTLVTSGSRSFRVLPEYATFDKGGSSIFFEDEGQLLPTLSFLNSRVANFILNILNSTLNLQVDDVRRLPFSSAQYREISASTECLAELSKSDWDAYETSWDFTTLPLLSPDNRGETLADSYATLRTHWQSMTDEMKALEEENNRIFIDAYGLQDELPPEVPIEEITLTCNPAYRYGVKGSENDRETRLCADTMAEFLSYAVGCMFGRYSLDAPGLILANQGERLEDYLARVPEPSFMPDEDNVIPVLDENWFPDDITERFRLFLRVSFGEAHFRENLKFIEDSLGKDIRKYFTKDFYADHVKRYKKRPIYWMVSSPKGTFNALIYMHRYRGDTVSVLLNDYLREFITKLEGERARLEKLADDPTATQGQKTKALKDVASVAKQIDELNEWERDVIFPLAQQKIEIDLDDGVKANYPKFGTALKKIAGLS
ncbi:BREX-1 system adenine-specific DNA-methyltransferase PglX [Sulfitobacter mediterraneus]|uniref:BREX-1 system adenine-specific DNA-methyltransferase PglX n=1 Tax=Sulfitobacter mediterraneus TaxID=83219 RepID=UPI0019313744|nr:BREX-1 system adenine-specific DNA-methyltransferase PglX [Sulfitobacter mediterraneus]MBM1631322.1 BREX-1 system adenine-specific DNA-methyltransferase PglX [Sulfitobacter mediterraneus]MBM1639135.1 BREX-1 system adenine-specific DNA-methyltransferase PglX [Sulfitobacter mediterraneus]MBM1643184.1 BREX-1 system adenine-specific DNA-methyltransferase PglX [Sulfitobacter mediterraneus]MBM1647232.1 BREX-1 system adenine-specific DNA-methyltransferase PglX [Sulfitobacter mediterraneus]MBM16512